MRSNFTQVFIPLVLSLYDALTPRKLQSPDDWNVPDQDIYQITYQSSPRWYLDSRFRHVLPTLLVTLGCHLAPGLWSGTSSNYICPLAGMEIRTVPLMQFVAAALDCHLAIVAYGLCLRRPARGEKSGRSALPAWGSLLLVSITAGVDLSLCTLTTSVLGRSSIVDHHKLHCIPHECGIPPLVPSSPVIVRSRSYSRFFVAVSPFDCSLCLFSPLCESTRFLNHSALIG